MTKLFLCRTGLPKLTYTYEVGNRKTVLENSGAIITWTYDATYQLTREQRS
jgi:hypothetical protein